MIQGECERCTGRGEIHGLNCIVRKLIFDRDFKHRRPKHVSREQAMELAVKAIEDHLEREREKKKMSETQTQELAPVKPRKQLDTAAVESFMIQADINRMNEEQVTNYIRKLCELVAINPITRPFDIILSQGKKTMYANKGCAEQLRNIWKISLRIVKREVVEGVYVVTAAAQMPDGRVDESTGCVWIEGVKGEARANAMMKAETKAKRRVTLSICGLNMPDDSEVDSIPGAQRHVHQPKTVSKAQIARMFAIAKEIGINSKEELKDWISEVFNRDDDFSLTSLTMEEYDEICSRLEKKTESCQPGDFTSPEVLEPESKAKSNEVPWAKYRETDPQMVK